MSIEAMKLALDALEDTHYRIIRAGLLDQDLLNRNFTVATALRERLAQPEQEPVAWMVWSENNVPALTFTKPADKYVFDALYTHPPQRTWVGLTNQEQLDIFAQSVAKKRSDYEH